MPIGSHYNSENNTWIFTGFHIHKAILTESAKYTYADADTDHLWMDDWHQISPKPLLKLLDPYAQCKLDQI